MDNKRFGIIPLFIVGLLMVVLTACASATATPEDLAGTAVALPDEVISGAQSQLSDALGIQADSIQIDKVEDVQWSDACLELGQPDENCAQVITPGYRVTLTVDGKSYEVHTNADGSMIRLKQ